VVLDNKEPSENSEENRDLGQNSSTHHHNSSSPEASDGSPSGTVLNEPGPELKHHSIDAEAPASAGEISLPSVSTTDHSRPPHRYLLDGLKGIFSGLKQLLKNRRLMITAGALGASWFLLLVLQAAGISNGFLRFLNFLTFAQGGASGGILGFAGGLAGKGLFAYMVSGFFTSGFSLNGLKGSLHRFKSLPGYFNNSNQGAITSLLAGASLALVAFNIMSGNASPINSMAGITGLVLSAGALSNQNSFLRRFMQSLMAKPASTGAGGNSQVSYIMAGITAGFALSIPLAFIPFSGIGYAAGGVLLIAAVTLKLVRDRKQLPADPEGGYASEG